MVDMVFITMDETDVGPLLFKKLPPGASSRNGISPIWPKWWQTLLDAVVRQQTSVGDDCCEMSPPVALEPAGGIMPFLQTEEFR